MMDTTHLNQLVARVKAAQRVYASYSQEQVDAIFRAAALAAADARIPLAKLAAEETRMGVIEDKVIKNHFASEYIYNKYKDDKTCGVIDSDPAFGIQTIAEPIGLLCGIVPTTNPTSTAIFKALICLKTRNGIVFSPHPRAKRSTCEAARVVLDAAVKAGAPADIIGWIDEPTVELSNQLMHHPDINLILATGGPGMRGKPGTKVTLTIARKNVDKPIVVTLTRAIIRTKSVKFKLIEPGYGYVRITQFQERTAENLASAMQSMYKSNKGDLKGLILDLRDDPGGLLNGAVGVAAAFLPKDALVVYTQGRTPDSKMHLTANLANYANSDGSNPLSKLPAQVHNVPMVVLVNGGSASASEIVAGALQDSKRALIIGTQTFGKGSVQSILPLSNDGGIRLTTSRYFTPSGRSIQAKGITPDILADDGNTAYQAFSVREADLEGHLANPNGDDSRTAQKPATPAAPKAPQPQPQKPARTLSDGNDPDPSNDYQLGQALNTLKVQQLLLKKAN